MQALSPAIEVYPVHHLPILKAYADQLGLVSLINHDVPTEMGVDAGTVALALGVDTLSGRSPLSRLEEFFAQHDTELLLGKAVPPQAWHAESAAMCPLIRPPVVSGVTITVPRRRTSPCR